MGLTPAKSKTLPTQEVARNLDSADVRSPDVFVKLDLDTDGQPIGNQEKRKPLYIMLNKPA